MLAAQETCAAVGKLLGIDAAGAAVLDRRDPRTAAGRPPGRRAAACSRPQGRQLACRRARHHDHRHRGQGGLAAVEIDGKTVTVTGISKGAGMIKPNMATMLGFVATDAGIAEPLLQQLVREAADESFNCITVDGDTSTNDSFILIATGQSGVDVCRAAAPGYASARGRDRRRANWRRPSCATAKARPSSSPSPSKAAATAKNASTRRLRHRPLAAGQDRFLRLRPQPRPHPRRHRLRRIDALDVDRVRVWLGSAGREVLVAENGGRAASYREEDGARIMQAAEITVRVDLGRGAAKAKVYTCDFSYDYVKINADYRSYVGRAD
jgi:glutamate N-acetyltransferase/amino-acid N-acetyltransferase